MLIWAPSYFVIGSVDTWQLIINTATTIITFLMVASLQNSETRSAWNGANAPRSAVGTTTISRGSPGDTHFRV